MTVLLIALAVLAISAIIGVLDLYADLYFEARAHRPPSIARRLIWIASVPAAFVYIAFVFASIAIEDGPGWIKRKFGLAR